MLVEIKINACGTNNIVCIDTMHILFADDPIVTGRHALSREMDSLLRAKEFEATLNACIRTLLYLISQPKKTFFRLKLNVIYCNLYPKLHRVVNVN